MATREFWHLKGHGPQDAKTPGCRIAMCVIMLIALQRQAFNNFAISTKSFSARAPLRTSLWDWEMKILGAFGDSATIWPPPSSQSRFANVCRVFIKSVSTGTVVWHSGRTSVFGRRTFRVLRSTCS